MKRALCFLPLALAMFTSPSALAQDKAPETYVEPAKEEKGPIADLSMSIIVPVGQIADAPGAYNMSDFGPGQRWELRGGWYFTRHIGVVVGANFALHKGGGCEGDRKDGCIGLSLQAPVLVQYSFGTRKEGLYVEAGLGLFAYYKAMTPAGDLSFSNNVGEMKLGLGYRISETMITGSHKPSRQGLDIYATADGGKFSSLRLSGRGPEVSGDIQKTAFHATFGFGFAWHFTP